MPQGTHSRVFSLVFSLAQSPQVTPRTALKRDIARCRAQAARAREISYNMDKLGASLREKLGDGSATSKPPGSATTKPPPAGDDHVSAATHTVGTQTAVDDTPAAHNPAAYAPAAHTPAALAPAARDFPRDHTAGEAPRRSPVRRASLPVRGTDSICA